MRALNSQFWEEKSELRDKTLITSIFLYNANSELKIEFIYIYIYIIFRSYVTFFGISQFSELQEKQSELWN